MMKTRPISHWFFATCLFIIACGSDPVAAPPTDENSLDDGILKVLFIGNSHTYYNELPQIFKTIALSSGYPDSILVMSATPGGFTFKGHSESEQTKNAIASDNWDWVVLQENAGSASLPLADAETMVYPYASQIKNLIAKNNAGTEILLYMTHAYQNGSPDCSQNPAVCTYELMQNEIRRNYLLMEKSINATLAPAGMMWKIILSQKGMDLWFADSIHPSPTGSYISALTIFSVMFGQPLGMPLYVPGPLLEDERQLIFNTLNQSLFDQNPDWRTF